ncbi:hypothetical protein FRC09_011973, partial [Ceratobasidium sp. 395]
MSPRLPMTLSAKALLFDMDGTLVDSTAAVEGKLRYQPTVICPFADIARKNRRLGNIRRTLSAPRHSKHLKNFTWYAHPVKHTLERKKTHIIPAGVRSVDNMRRHVLPPGTPEAECEAEADRFEIEIIASAKHAKDTGKDGIIYLPGTEDILAVARAARAPAPRRAVWAICTSATPIYAASALATVGIPVPTAFVTARDVAHGKPFPDPYIQGAQKCNVDPKDCVVFEDAPSGIRSGKAAGCKVIALLTSHSREAVEAAEPDIIVEDLSHV